ILKFVERPHDPGVGCLGDIPTGSGVEKRPAKVGFRGACSGSRVFGGSALKMNKFKTGSYYKRYN
ncbi:MAG: hypothetical protein RR432_06980, partial [Alistipes sp.]